ncbi:hypothetical protein KP509_04G041400 [Ceratopteris richardii]|uniref:Uncharacterized protein n=1 Tax=Ceratopteris richardii TaxID=49495 RepID=A0A8T2UZW3_CERRI|nr:hypothetical protein KP509_04G041400 [Ceratopteris richardii]
METFEAIFGQAEGSLEEAIPCALLPFVFLLHSSDGKSLRFHVSDFHSNTWQTIRTHELLEDLRDQVGIGGTWDDFIQYIRDAFLSENVKLILGGPASSIGGHGATTARVVAQKSRGMPRISLNLEKLTGSPAEDVMGLIMVELLKSYRHKSNALQIEEKNVCQLKEMVAKLKEETKTLQEQVDAAFHRGKRRGRVGASQFSTEITDAPLSQFDSKVGDTQTTFDLDCMQLHNRKITSQKHPGELFLYGIKCT